MWFLNIFEVVMMMVARSSECFDFDEGELLFIVFEEVCFW
jgi:hypothetical protein